MAVVAAALDAGRSGVGAGTIGCWKRADEDEDEVLDVEVEVLGTEARLDEEGVAEELKVVEVEVAVAEEDEGAAEEVTEEEVELSAAVEDAVEDSTDEGGALEDRGGVSVLVVALDVTDEAVASDEEVVVVVEVEVEEVVVVVELDRGVVEELRSEVEDDDGEGDGEGVTEGEGVAEDEVVDDEGTSDEDADGVADGEAVELTTSDEVAVELTAADEVLVAVGVAPSSKSGLRMLNSSRRRANPSPSG